MRQFIFTFFLCVVFGAVWGQGDETFNEFQRDDMPAVVPNSNCQSSVANTATIDLANGNIHVDASIFRGEKGNDNLKMTINAKNTNNVLSILKEGSVKPEAKVQLDYNICMFDKKDTYYWTTITGGIGTGAYTAFDSVPRKKAVAFTDTSGFTGKVGLGFYAGWKIGEDRYYCLGIQSAFESTNNIQDLPILNVEYTTGNDSVKVTESKYARKGSFQTFNQLSARVDFLAYLGGVDSAKYALNIFAIGAQRFYANNTNNRFVVSPGFAFFIPLRAKEDKNKVVHIGVQFMTKDIFGDKATNTKITQRTQLDLVVGIPIFKELSKKSKERLEKERLEKLEKEKLEKLGLEKLELELEKLKLEKEKLEKSNK